jgi:hypothetical protein
VTATIPAAVTSASADLSGYFKGVQNALGLPRRKSRLLGQDGDRWPCLAIIICKVREREHDKQFAAFLL